jgi:MFS transporter, AAHS family, 4-hydroxybenzoate transporter
MTVRISTAYPHRGARGTLGLCCVVSMLDGYDTQVIAFTAPTLAHQFRIALPMFGFIFSAGLAGSMVGSVLAGYLADRYGRRRLMIASVALFGAATVMASTASSVGAFVVLRAAAGLGLGGAMPNFIAIASEIAPQNMRTRFVAMVLWGFPIGAVLGGLLSIPLIERLGAQWAFIAGGALPLLLLPLLYFRLPESQDWLLATRTKMASGRRESADRGYPAIFRGEYRHRTFSLALSLFFCLLLAYLLVTWIPLLLRAGGLSNGIAMGGAVALNLGGIIGSYGLTRLIDSSMRPLPLIMVALCTSSIAVGIIGTATVQAWTALVSILLTGIALIGGQMTLSSFSSTLYPTRLRATAVGFIQATGRLGALLGPLVASGLLSLGLPVVDLLRFVGVAALFAAAALIPLRSGEGT